MASQTARRYHVLTDDLDDAFFISLEDLLGEIATTTGIDLRFVESRDLGIDQEAHLYRQEDGPVRLTVTEDGNLGIGYFMIEGPNEGVSKIDHTLATRLAARPLAEWQELAEQAKDHEPVLLIKMAIASGEDADPRTLRILADALDSPSTSVRLKAVEAASLTQWQELATPLAKMYEQDDDPGVRDLAGTALQLLLAARSGRR
ncbi:HEAT repeat domain-containing protein [Micromonospora rubida]